jgi:hypothetical protein
VLNECNRMLIYNIFYVECLYIDLYFQCTEDTHKDKPELLNAVKTMMSVAAYINEYKRRKDIGKFKTRWQHLI